MEAVIDSNFLRSPELRVFLELSRRNRAVLTDYSAIEAYKNDDPIAVMAAQMEILSAFPSQVVILKGTAQIAGLRGRKRGLRRRLIDQDQTAHFPKLGRDLIKARNGDIALRSVIAAYAQEARQHIEAITSDMVGLVSGIVDMAKIYTPAELRVLRTGGAFTESMIKKFADYSMLLAAKLHQQHPNSPGPPCFEEMFNTFLFRSAVCMQLMVLRWAETGGKTRKPEDLRNDVIDLNFVTHATFFDEFFTNDRRARDLYAEAKVALSVIVPPRLMP